MKGRTGEIPEPEEAKNLELAMWVEIGRIRLIGTNIDLDSEVIWRGDKLVDYLWRSWKKDLEQRKFSKRQFQQLMRYTTDDVLLWAYDRICWSELLERIMSLINGDLGKAILEGCPL